MGAIFISHSSQNNEQALVVRNWLCEQGWTDIFLDLDAEQGLAPGQRWQEELKKAGERCAAVVILVSPAWAASKWCLVEFLLASQLGKLIFPVIIETTPFEDLPVELIAHFQTVDISTTEREAEGFERLRFGMQRAGLELKDFPWPPSDQPRRSPYRGLQTFKESDAAIFFGRESAIIKGLDSLRRMRDGSPERMFVVMGASGSGKSSFLRAGLLSRLERDTENYIILPIVRPERAALTGPKGFLHAFGMQPGDAADILVERFKAIRKPIMEKCRIASRASGDVWNERKPTLVLPIDQGEEFFAAEHDESGPALDLLAAAFAVDTQFIVALTIRSDNFEKLQGENRLADVPRLPFDLPKLSPAAFKEVIEGPGQLAEPPIEVVPELTERLLQDLNAADALPLLAFTLERLVTDYGDDGRLRLEEYERGLKGLTGAITKAINAGFESGLEDPALPNTRNELEVLIRRAFIPWLVRVDDLNAPPKRRVALLDDLPEETRRLISHLIDQHLLVSDVRDDGEVTVEVSHEAVLRNWGQLSNWIVEEQATLIYVDRLVRAAQEWIDAEQQLETSEHSLLLVHRGERLAEAENLLERDDLSRMVGRGVRDYVIACRHEENLLHKREQTALKRQRLLQRKISIAMVAAMLITLAGAWLVVNGQRNLRQSQSLMLERTAQEFYHQGDFIRSLRLSILASRDHSLSLSTDEAKNTVALSAQVLNQLVIFQHYDKVNGARFSRGETRVLTWSNDNTAKIWDIATGLQVGPTFEHDGRIRGAVLTQDENRMLTWSNDNTAKIWDVENGKQYGLALEHDGIVAGAVFSQDETRVLTWSNDNTARIWDVETSAQIGPSFEHDNILKGAVFSQDESRVLTWSNDKTAQIWDVANGAKATPTFQHEGTISGAVFSHDESYVLTWSNDNTARIWDTASGSQIGQPLGHGDTLNGAAFMHDDDRVLTWGNDDTARIWDLTTSTQVGSSFEHDNWVIGAALSKDESRLLTWSADNSARIWDVKTGMQFGQPLEHDDWVIGATFSDDERRILTWSDDRSVRIWDAATSIQTGRSLQHDVTVKGAVFSSDESRVLTWSSNGTALIWNVASGTKTGGSLEHDSTVTGAVFSQDENRVLTWSNDNTAKIWDTASDEEASHVLEHEGQVRGAAFSQDESRVLTWSDDNTVRIWDAFSGGQLGQSFEHSDVVRGAQFSQSEDRVLTWGSDNTARIWNVETEAEIGPSLQHAGVVTGASFSQDESRLLTWSNDNTARIWDVISGQQIGLSLRHDDTVTGAVFTTNESHVLTWGHDSTARLWNIATGGQAKHVFEHDAMVNGALFSSDESNVLTWSNDNTARIWDAASGEQMGGSFEHNNSIVGAVFSKDESRLLTWSSDNTVRLWEVSTGEQVTHPLQHDSVVRGAMFSSDESRVLSWSDDNTARLWDATVGTQLGRALEHDAAVIGALYSGDESQVLTWGHDNTARIWNVRLVANQVVDSAFIERVCEEQLRGVAIESVTFDNDGPTRNPILNVKGQPLMLGPRHLDEVDISAAPILRDREGEDVCEWNPRWYDGVSRALIELLF